MSNECDDCGFPTVTATLDSGDEIEVCLRCDDGTSMTLDDEGDGE